MSCTSCFRISTSFSLPSEALSTMIELCAKAYFIIINPNRRTSYSVGLPIHGMQRLLRSSIFVAAGLFGWSAR